MTVRRALVTALFAASPLTYTTVATAAPLATPVPDAADAHDGVADVVQRRGGRR